MGIPSDEDCQYTPFLSYRMTIGHRRGKEVRRPRSQSGTHFPSLVSPRTHTKLVGRGHPPHQLVHLGERPSQSPRGAHLSFCRLGEANDPFTSLPVNPQIPEVCNVIDFFKSVWCSTRPAAQSVNTLIPGLVSEAIRKESLLKALVAYGQAYHECVHRKQVQPSVAFLARLGPLIEHLRSLLHDPDHASVDEAILLIYILIGIGRVTGVQARETHSHFEGMGHLIQRRGGIENLGLNGVVKAVVVLQQFFTIFRMPTTPAISNPLHDKIPANMPADSFTSPADLAAPDMLEKVCSLPYALSSFALAGSLSHGLVEATIDFHRWQPAPRTVDGDTKLLESIYRAHSVLDNLCDDADVYTTTRCRRPWRDICLETVLCLTLETLAAEVFYGAQIHAIAPQAATRMAGLANTRFWASEDHTQTQKGYATLLRKCMAWALMVVAEAVDPCQDGNAASLMAAVFDMQSLDDVQDASPGILSQEAESQTAWDRFDEQVLQQFLCPAFLVKEWKHCWLKYWGKPGLKVSA